MGILCLLTDFSSFAQISSKQKQRLSEQVREDVMNQVMTGTQVYKIKHQYVLVTVVMASSKMNLSAQIRVADMKARRNLGEFLEGAKNHSVSVYHTEQEESEVYLSDNGSLRKMDHSGIGSDIHSNVNETDKSRTTEFFSDRDVQESVSNIGKMQSLMRFTDAEGENVYAYYIMLSKSRAKSKY